MANSGDDILEMMEARKAVLENELKKINAAIEAYHSAASDIDSTPTERLRQLKLHGKPKRTQWTKLVKDVFKEHNNLKMDELIEILKNEKGIQSLENNNVAKNSLGTTIYRLRNSGFLEKDDETGVISKKVRMIRRRVLVDEKESESGDQSKLEL